MIQLALCQALQNMYPCNWESVFEFQSIKDLVIGHGEDLTRSQLCHTNKRACLLTLAEASQGSLNMIFERSKWFVNCMAEAQIEFAEEGLDQVHDGNNKAQKDVRRFWQAHQQGTGRVHVQAGWVLYNAKKTLPKVWHLVGRHPQPQAGVSTSSRRKCGCALQ